MLALGVAVGVALWLWLYRTRTGMVIRAGVDDRQMTSALGVNIQLTFAIAFVVGSALAAFGGVVGASQGGVASGQDGQWLLNSLVVVIIGGMGSLLGAAAGSLLYGLVFSFSAVYLPTTGDNCCTQYSIVFTFVLLALVLAFRPQGLFGRDAMRRWTPKTSSSARSASACSCSWRSAPAIFNDYWVDAILTQTFILGIAAASLIFLSAYGGMVSLAQTALMGIAGFVSANMVTQRAGGETKGLSSAGTRRSRSCSRSSSTTAIGLVFGAVAARSPASTS